MTQIPAVTGGGNSQSAKNASSIQDLDVDHFLKLLIAELQNQDPLSPMENSEMVAQISAIREVGATDKLTSTLDAVVLGQNLSSATSLIGNEIRGIDNQGKNVEGTVDRVTVIDGAPVIHVGASNIKLSNVGEIRATG